MKRKCLAIGIILLFVGVTIAPTINFNTVKASQQNVIKDRINQRELLFQTIVDIANNKEIQRIILKSQMSRGIFPSSEISLVTKNQIKEMYFLGLILSKFISKSRIQSLVGKYQFNNQEMHKMISSVIEKDTIINSEITQLKNSECDCEKNIKEEKISITTSIETPIICTFLLTMILSADIIFSHDILALFLWITIFPVMLSIWIVVFISIFLYFDIFDCYPDNPKYATYTK